MNQPPKVLEEEALWRSDSGRMWLERATLEEEFEDGPRTYKRIRLVQRPFVCALIYNTDQKAVVLVRQHRYPAQTPEFDGMMLEIPAGLLDEGESLEEACIRESLEESGYDIKASLEPVYSFYPSPGTSTQEGHLFRARVKDRDRIARGGGLSVEDEQIVVEHHDPRTLDFKTFRDAKTILALQHGLLSGFFD